jgi:hypothetical protein
MDGTSPMEAPMAEGAMRDTSTFTLWRLRSGENESRCVVSVTPVGLEAQMRLNGRLLYSQTLSCLDEVMAWAQVRGSEMVEHGWRFISDESTMCPRESLQRTNGTPAPYQPVSRAHALTH